jgi:hypothetical protein
MTAPARLFWMSFVDTTQPPGRDRFLGVTIMEVTDAERLAVLPEMRALFPNAKPGAEWLMAASRKAYARGCNPGGEVLTTELDLDDPQAAALPRERLLTRQELVELGTEPGPPSREQLAHSGASAIRNTTKKTSRPN